MDARRALPFLLLAICAISAVSTFRNVRGGPNFVRRARRISLNEYLVPPPPPRLGRTGRLAVPPTRPTEAPGYFSRFMSWLNPFGTSAQPSPISETSYLPPPPASADSSTRDRLYEGPPPPVYDRPPLLPASPNDHPVHSYPAKGKNCNPCNKAPWMPIQQTELSHSGVDAPLAPPPPSSPAQLPPLNVGYLPPDQRLPTHQDTHHAASQEVRIPDLHVQIGDQVLASPLPNLHLFPAAIPPFFKAEEFNNPVQSGSDGSLSGVTAANGEYGGQSAQPNLFHRSNLGTVHHGLIHDGDGGEAFGIQNHRTQTDLSSSGSQISHGHVDLVPDKQQFEGTVISQGPLNQQGSFNGDNEAYQHVTGPNGSLDDLFDNSSQIELNPPSSYGTSSLGQVTLGNLEHPYNDLSSSGSVAKKAEAPLRTSDESSARIQQQIHFEQSPLLDLTRKDESRTDLPSIPSSSHVFLDVEGIAETAETTSAPGDGHYGTRQHVAAAESHFSTARLPAVDPAWPSAETKINDSTTAQNKNNHDPKDLRGKDVSYIPPSGQPEILWPSVLSTTSRSTGRESLLSTLVKSYDGVREMTPTQNADINSDGANGMFTKARAVGRNKQVQVIIPYTSQYTPLPFHSPNGRGQARKISHVVRPDRDDYLSEESRNRIKVTGPPDTIRTWPITTVRSVDGGKPLVARFNNSIDVHRLQKNIDNWTIQEYSKGTTASTVSPSSVNPYLFPSKQIPDEYLTTTEPADHIDGSQENNVKSFTLAGFTFNDLEHEGSASNRVEGVPVQVIRQEEVNSTESSIDSLGATAKDEAWRGFSVVISPVNKERVYVVTPQPVVTTPRPNRVESKREKTAKEAERDAKDTDTKTPKNVLQSIERAYQVLPQAVNNLAMASTGPENVPLWGIMEHEEFASDEHDNEDEQLTEIPILYGGHSKVSRGKR